MADSFLDQRLGELRAGDQAVPLGYDALREAAREHLEEYAFDYAETGAGTGATKRANRAAFRRHRIVPRVLRDVSDREVGVELFGRSIGAPVCLAPVGGQARYHPDAELATARAAADLDVPMTLSQAASHSIEDVAAASDGPQFFQLYWPTDWAVTESLVGRAAAAGIDAIVVTLDSQIPTWRHGVLRHPDTGPPSSQGVLKSDPVVRRLAADADRPLDTFVHESPALAKDTTLTWDDLDVLRDWTDLPVVLKGILSLEDARRAADWGADGLVVSNHGGRQIDGEVAALDQLPGVVEAVGDDLSVWLDSGIRTGADVFKALALGADAVLLGRPYVYGLAIAGRRGVYETTLNCLAELESAMGLSGYTSIEDVDEDALVGAPSGPIE